MTTGLGSLSIDPATPADVPLLLGLIRELADYERLLHEARARPEHLQRHLFGPRPYAEAVVARAADSSQFDGNTFCRFPLMGTLSVWPTMRIALSS